jgi:hypothetical protein
MLIHVLINYVLVKNNTMKLNEKSKGLGDTIEKFTTATGIKNVVTKVTKAAGVNDCGCGQRRDTLNRVFPYKK